MKKFFRVALVCALAGATLLYTGCTKDYSEDLHNLQAKVDEQGKSISSLEDQVKSLQSAKTALEAADAQFQQAIDGLKSRVTALEKEVDTLKTEKARLENLINKNAGDIAALKDSLTQVDSLLGVLKTQIASINGKIDTLEATVKSHKDSLAALDAELQTMAKKAYVDGKIAELTAEIQKKANSTYVDSLVAKLREEIGAKGDKEYIDSLVTVITAELAKKADKTYVDSLVGALKSELQAAIDLKADKTYVDTELGKKADQTWVENQLKLYVTVETFNTTVAQFTGLLAAANKEIQATKKSLSDLYEFLGLVRDDETGAITKDADGLIAKMQANIDKLNGEMSQAQADIRAVTETANDASKKANAAVAFIGDLNKDGMTLEQYLNNTYYKKTEIDAFLAAVDQRLKDTLAYYVLLDKYVEDSAAIRGMINDIDTAIFDVIKSVNLEQPEELKFDETKVGNLAAAINALVDRRVDTATFNTVIADIYLKINDIYEKIDVLAKRVQSIVYVPDYDDNRITLNWAQLSEQNYFDTRDLPEGYDALPASFDTAKWNAFYKAVEKQFKENNFVLGPIVVPSDADFMALLQDLINSIVKTAGSMGKLPLIKESYLLKEIELGEFELVGGQVRPTEGYGPSEALMRIFMTSPSNAILQVIMFGIRMLDDVDFINEGDYGFETPIVEPSHIKYRIYGQDAVGTAAALAEKFDEVFNFDVIRVKTRSNDANVSLKITDAKADGDVIDFTVVPEGLPNRFWFYTWDMKNYSNPKLHSTYLRDALMAAFGDSEINIEILAYLLKQWVDNGGIDARTFVKSFFGERYARLGETADTVGGDAVGDDTEGELVGNSEFPAFSVSLVLTQADSSRFITSSYNNVVPAAVSDKIELVIKRGTEDISWDCVDTVKIVYSDLSEKGILENTALFFEKNGETMTDDEIAALNLGDPTARYFASYEHLSAAARQATDFPSPYFKNTADDAATVPAAKVQLTKSRKDGVGSEEYVILRYFVGPAYVETCGYVEVVRDQINITADLGETVENGKPTPFTWNYAAEWVRPATDPTVGATVLNDAKIDSAYYFVENAALPRYFRDSAVVVIKDAQKMIDSLRNAKNVIYPDDFKRLEPVDTLTQFTFYYGTAGFPETVKLSQLKDPSYHGSYAGFKVYPFFEGNELKAHVDSFYFFKPQAYGYDKNSAKGNVLPLTKISYKAVYVIDGALDVNVSGEIIVDDRDRAPITITLPTTKEDIYVNYNSAVSDSLFIDDAQNADITVATSLADHHIAAVADVADAFGKVSSKTWTGLTPSSYGGETTQSRDILYGCAEAAAGDPVNYQWVDGMGSDMEGGYAYLQNERIDSMTTTTRPITQAAPAEPVKALVRNNTTAHINTEFIADAKAGVKFNTVCNFNSRDLRNREITPKVDYDFYLTLWYGQDVNVTKCYDLNVDGIFEYERINEYVAYASDEDVYTTLQPKWSPDYATTDFTIPVNGYEANKVLLNQHFRIVDVKRDTTCTELDGTIITPKYNYLRRRFWLEKENKGALVDSIADPRRSYVPTWKGITENWGKNWAVTIVNPINAETQPNGEPNELSYYSMGDPTNVYADLFLVNSNGSFIKLGTRFDKPAANLIYATDKTIAETYENYVIKLYDPLKELVAPTDVKEININNSQVTVVSIYQFLSMKDKRGFELIDPENNGWVRGNVSPNPPYDAVVEGEDPNGFENQYYANRIYNLHFTHTMAYLSENVSPETKARITFDPETGLLRYQNDLQTQLAEPIDIQLTINVDDPWGHREGAVTVRFYNKPVGE